MTENYKRLIKLLKELFQIDRPDLDFGIYRIMNQKRDEITRFLDKDLLPQVKKSFAEYGSGGRGGIQGELEKMIANLKDAGIDPEQSPKVKELKEKLEAAVDVTELENEVYSHLYNFFRRYYKDGDFLSLRRYKKDVYAIPYEGEEVKLHWANADQYYIKSSENFRDYTFKLGDLPEGDKEDTRKTVHFKLVEADTEIANNKALEGKERRFVLCEDTPMVEENGELFIRFDYRPFAKKQAQKTLNESALKTIQDNVQFAGWVRELIKEENGVSILAKHLNSYTAKNSFDYFIHKDLGGFLRRELDFFIKNEVMHLDDIEEESAPRVEQYLSQIKVLRQIAHKLIKFLEQLENFQKKLWLKKKFVVETNYCITLDRVPEALYPEICANDAQREEWVELFAIDEIKEGLGVVEFSEPLSKEFLKENQHLVVDTAFFSPHFKNELIKSIDAIDDNTDGVLLSSDNFHALRLLKTKHKAGFGSIYIDPPYNTDGSPILYKNGYKNSTWVTLLRDRLEEGKGLLKKDGTLAAAIDDAQQKELGYILNDVFDGNNLGVICVRSNPSGRPMQTGYAVSHEYVLFAGTSSDSKIGRMPPTESQLARFSQTDEKGQFEWRNLRREGSDSDRSARPLMYYPIYINNGAIRVPPMKWNDDKNEWTILETPVTGENAVYPDNDNGVQKRWRWGHENVMKSLSQLGVRKDRSGRDYIYYKRRPNQSGVVSMSSWFDAKYSATEHGTALLKSMFSDSPFSYPKSIHTVEDSIYISGASAPNSTILDFFAGSGTTGHAIINLNRQDGGNRKYTLVEMGNYFEAILKKRIQKVVYSDCWSEGKPVSRKGSSHTFKYMSLESYEDALNNLALKQTDARKGLLDTSPALKEEYMLSYMMDMETEGSASLLNVDRFDDPWNYTMKIATGSAGETKVRPVDLVETFNYLIGLTVIRRDFIRGIEVIEGTNPDGDNVLVIWRNTNETNNEQLDEFFRKQDYNTRDTEFDLIYVNGDNNLENLRRPDQTWKVRLIEDDFKQLMFDVEDV